MLRVASHVSAVLLTFIWPCLAIAEVQYFNIPDVVVRGTWYQNPEGSIHVLDETVTLDLSSDAIDDIQLNHGFVLEPVLIPSDAVPYIDTAQTGMRAIRNLLLETRAIAIESASARPRC